MLLIYKKKYLAFIFASLFFFSFQSIATTGKIIIKESSLYHLKNQKKNYFVSLRFNYQLNDYLRNALKNGIKIKNEVNFFLIKKRKLWWNSSKKLTTLEITLRYHALSQHYQLIRLDTNEYWNFSSLSLALEKMGIVNHFLLPELSNDVMNNKKNYYIAAESSLISETSKLPVRIQSLFNKEYKLKSMGIIWRIP